MGIAGLGIILFFLLMAVTAPILIPWPRPVEVDLAPSICAPTWLLPFNPSGFVETYPITNSHFDDNSDGWVYGENCNYVEYIAMMSNFSIPINDTEWTYSKGGYLPTLHSEFNESYGFPTELGGSGPGSFMFKYIDTSTGASSFGPSQENITTEFEFDPNALGGALEDHPLRVYLQYAYSVEFLCDDTEMGSATVAFTWWLENSTGDTWQFSRRSWTSPLDQTFRVTYPFENQIPHLNASQLFPTTLDNLTLRLVVDYTNPNGPDTPRIIMHFDDIKIVIGATFNATTAQNVTFITGAFDSSLGSDLVGELATGSGAGCYHFVYNDNDDTIGYPNASAWVEYTFEWNELDTPRAAYLNYQYKVDFSGNIGDARLKIAQEVYVENTDETVLILRGDYITGSKPWTVSPRKIFDSFQLQDTFGQKGTLKARYKFIVYDPTPEDTPTIHFYFDDLVLEIHGDYFGSLGSGQYGEDLLAQLLWGSRIALLVGLLAAAIATFVGLIVGLVSGYFGGLVDEILMRVTDFFLIIPGLPLMIVLAAILGAGWYNIVLVIALIGWTGTARLVRSQVLAERQRAYVEAAHAIGASDLYIIFRHVLPNVTPLLFAQITLGVAGSILSEAGLAFLGLTHPNDVSWGRMLMQASQGGAYSDGAWWYVVFPGVCIVLLALSFTLVGYAVDEILNPRLRVRRQ